MPQRKTSPQTNIPRRDWIKATVAGSVALSTACSSDPDSCTATQAQTEGPFYPGKPEAVVDVRGDRTGETLSVELEILAAGSCEPLPNAEVDLWCADADGKYSGYEEMETAGEDWLRGRATTDSSGKVKFTTIVPGSYEGRAAHLHVKVRAEGRDELTTQVYLSDDITTPILAQDTYSKSAKQTLLKDDDFNNGDTLLDATGSPGNGYSSTGKLYVAENA